MFKTVVENMTEIFFSIIQIFLTFILLNHEYKLQEAQTLIKNFFVKCLTIKITLNCTLD